jgi:hypothetical protein
MKGYILIFDTHTNKDAVELNHKLFGRIISVPRKDKIVRYYKRGILDTIPHKRLIEGCYFTTGDIGFEDKRLKKISADVDIYETNLVTGRGYWVTHANKHKMEVKNLV